MDNKKYCYFCIVIDPQKESANPRQELAQYQNLIDKYYKTFFYVSMIHDKDKYDNGEDKLIHAHIYLEFADTDKRTCKQVLKELANVLNINQNQIQIDGTYNNYLYIQYLGSHKNDKDKYQYDHTQARTNDLLTYEERYNKSYEAPPNEKELILEDLKNCSSLIEFANKHGLDTANKYRNLFKDFKNEQHTDIKELNSMLESYERFVERLKDSIQRYKTNDNHIDIDIIINLIKTIF